MQLRNAMTELRIPRHSDAKNPSNIQIRKVMSLSKKLQKGRTGRCETQEGDVALVDETSSANSRLRWLSLRKWNDSLTRIIRVAGSSSAHSSWRQYVTSMIDKNEINRN